MLDLLKTRQKNPQVNQKIPEFLTTFQCNDSLMATDRTNTLTTRYIVSFLAKAIAIINSKPIAPFPV